MNASLLSGALLLTLAFGAAAQAPQRPAPILSPELADGHVTFRLLAPQAKEVSLRGQWSRERVPLVRDGNGLWTVTVDPAPAGIWEYNFSVDGLSVIDPRNPALKPQREPAASILHVPSKPPAAWDWQDVPHGTVHGHTYASKVLGRPRELLVYTPPGYERDTAKTFPLLVLQHGSGDNYRTWVAHGKANWIFDNLISAGKAQPMVVLMLDGHPNGMVPTTDAGARTGAMEAFQRELFEDALPLVDSVYRVEKGAAHRAIAGLSMGGGQSLTVGLGNLDRFGWVGAFSAGLPSGQVMEKFLAVPESTNSKLRLLWIACGKEDRLRQRNEEFAATLKEKGIRHEWHLTDGDHSWPVWRGYLVDFAPRLFRAESAAPE